MLTSHAEMKSRDPSFQLVKFTLAISMIIIIIVVACLGSTAGRCAL